MTKVEMVRVRSAPETLKQVMPRVVEHVENLRSGMGPNTVEILHHAKNQGDVVVFIFWGDDHDEEKSREGLLVTDILQEIGATTHIVWLGNQMERR